MAKGKKKTGTSGKSKAKTTPHASGQQTDDMSKWRGVGTFDTNESVLLVRGPVEDVAGAFVKLKKAQVWKQEMQDIPIIVYYPSCIVFQLKGHPWVTVFQLTGVGGDLGPKPADAASLSRTLGTRAIYFGNSDTASATRFDVYEKGRRLEYFELFEGIKFESTLHDPKQVPEDGPEIYPFVDRLVRDQDAWVSGTLSWLAPPSGIASGARYQIQLQTDADEPMPVVRLDYVAASALEKNPQDQMVAWMRTKLGITDDYYKPQKKRGPR
jgi:hypothetical protein